MGLGFAHAMLIRPGDCVQVGGQDRKVLAVITDGKYSPYFQLDDRTINVIPYGTDGLVSWQVCGISAYWNDRLIARSIVEQEHASPMF